MFRCIKVKFLANIIQATVFSINDIITKVSPLVCCIWVVILYESVVVSLKHYHPLHQVTLSLCSECELIKSLIQLELKRNESHHFEDTEDAKALTLLIILQVQGHYLWLLSRKNAIAIKLVNKMTSLAYNILLELFSL